MKNLMFRSVPREVALRLGTSLQRRRLRKTLASPAFSQNATMKHLNEENGTNLITQNLARKLMEKFETGTLLGAELGIAYGGGVESIGQIWKGRGVIHGYDTFEGQPKQLSYDSNSYEASCLDKYYEEFGKGEALTYDYQRKKLDEQGLDNVILHKGLLNTHSLDDIPYLHYALLDLDLIVSMALGIHLVKDKIVKGGYLCLHDVLPKGHIFGLWGLYQELVSSNNWKVQEVPFSYLAVLKRK
jgi:hypothetical protein